MRSPPSYLTLRGIAIACMAAAALTACDRQPPHPATASSDSRAFEGSWTASGTRRTIPLGADRKGSIIDLRGTMLLSGPDRPGVGFRAEVIGLSDTETGFTGRGVWTDEHGDQVFSELKGEGTRESNHITGTFLGGTGRYAHATGTYEFSWQFVIESEDGSIQGRAIGLKGRFQLGQAKSAGGKP